MKIESVNIGKQPEYPTIELFVEHPELLSRSVPGNWLKNRFVATSLMAFLLSSTGATKDVGEQVIESTSKYTDTRADNREVINNDPVIKVAPVFAHGEGRGAVGCVVMTPPVFISEDEALKIIADALKKQGIPIDKSYASKIIFTAPPIFGFSGDDDKKAPDAKVKLKMDGYNKDLNLAIQYVSIADFEKFISDDGCRSSVQGIYTKEAAEIIREKLMTTGKTNAVVFYDPLVLIDPFVRIDGKHQNWKESSKKAKTESRDLLLKQVDDFINWLKNNNLGKK